MQTPRERQTGVSTTLGETAGIFGAPSVCEVWWKGREVAWKTGAGMRDVRANGGSPCPGCTHSPIMQPATHISYINLDLGRREKKEGIKGEAKVGEQEEQALGGQCRRLGRAAATSLALAGADNASCDSCPLAAAH